eukprot:4764613-Amphidinium_carterae.1
MLAGCNGVGSVGPNAILSRFWTRRGSFSCASKDLVTRPLPTLQANYPVSLASSGEVELPYSITAQFPVKILVCIAEDPAKIPTPKILRGASVRCWAVAVVCLLASSLACNY